MRGRLRVASPGGRGGEGAPRISRAVRLAAALLRPCAPLAGRHASVISTRRVHSLSGTEVESRRDSTSTTTRCPPDTGERRELTVVADEERVRPSPLLRAPPADGGSAAYPGDRRDEARGARLERARSPPGCRPERGDLDEEERRAERQPRLRDQLPPVPDRPLRPNVAGGGSRRRCVRSVRTWARSSRSATRRTKSAGRARPWRLMSARPQTGWLRFGRIRIRPTTSPRSSIMSKSAPAADIDRDELRRRLSRTGVLGLVHAFDEAESKPRYWSLDGEPSSPRDPALACGSLREPSGPLRGASIRARVAS